MIAQALVFNENRHVLMVRQYVQRGDIVWNFPGGRIEPGESPEAACIREVREETGYTVQILRLLCHNPEADNGKCTYLAQITGGTMQLDHTLPDNDDIIDAAWVRRDDAEKWDQITLDILSRFPDANTR